MSEASTSSTRLLSEPFRRAVPANRTIPPEQEGPVLLVKPPCAPDFPIPLRILPSDREQLERIAGRHGNQLPMAFELDRRCAICGRHHGFRISLADRERKALLGFMGEATQETGSEPVTSWKSYAWPPALERGARPSLHNVAETPLAKANRLYNSGREEADGEKAIAALEEAAKLYDSVPHRKSAAAQARLAQAELLVEHDPVSALALLKQLLPILTGPALRGPRERALILEERLAS